MTSSNNLVIPNLNTKLIGSTVKFVCNTVATTKWAFNGGLLPNASIVLKDKNTLLIIKVSFENRGLYQCFNEEKSELLGIAMLQIISKCKLATF